MRTLISAPFFLLLIGCAQAGFTVNTTQDFRDADPGDGLCRAVGNADLCSLRAAIEEADAAEPGTTVHHITLPAGTYLITELSDVPNPHDGLAMAHSSVNIHGAGADITEIRSTFDARHFTVIGGSLEITGVALRDGVAFGLGNGGSVSSEEATVLLDSMIIEDNRSGFRGGAIYAVGATLGSRLAISNSVIRNNDAALGAQGAGGGIYSDVGTELVRVTLEGNHAGQGGGLFLAAVRPSYIRSSAFVDNRAHTGAGFKSQADSVAVSQSTFSANIACSSGGGISATDGRVDVISSTIAYNRVEHFGGQSILCDDAGRDGAGLLAWGATVSLTNTLVSENTHLFARSDCPGEILSGGFNLVGTNDGCDFDAATSDVVGPSPTGSPIDPLLGELTSAMSPTPYHLPASDSPAVDEGAACGSIDQRGRPRPVDGDGNGGIQCDIGSVERP